METSELNDPIWEYTLVTKLQPYIEAVKGWWATYSQKTVTGTGIFDFEFAPGIEPIEGLYIRMTSTPVRSPIKNVQMFPFLPATFLQLGGVPGGVCRMIERECTKGLVIDGIKIIEKHNLPATYHKGQIICFVPEEVYNGAKELGKYVYLTVEELCAISSGILPKSVVGKAGQYKAK